MPNVELIQAEVAVIEAGIVLAKVNVGLVEAKIEKVKASLESVKASAGSMAAKILAVEAEVEAVKEDIGMVEAELRFFRFEPGQAGHYEEEKSSTLRAHIELDNDKLSVTMRELNQVDRDIRHPRFAVAGRR